MPVGDVFRQKKIRASHPDGKGWTEWVPKNKDQVFVVVLIGFEPLRCKPKEELNADAALRAMGLKPPTKRATRTKMARRGGIAAEESKP